MNIAQIIPLADTWGMHGDVGWGWMTLMMPLMVLFWAAVVFGIVWLIRSAARGGPAPSGETSVSREAPVEILERRFAEGALTLEDYRARREVLVNGNAEPNRASTDKPQGALTQEKQDSEEGTVGVRRGRR